MVGLRGTSREKLSKVLRQSKGAISSTDASRALNIERAEAARLLSNWFARGWLSRVRRGLYVSIPIESSTSDLALDDALVVADRLFAPCYIGEWSAAIHWGLTEQFFRSTLVVTTRRPRARRVDARGTIFVVRTVDKGAMFGLKTIWRGKAKVNVPDPTRTVVDLLDTPELGGGIRTVVDILKSYFSFHLSRPETPYPLRGPAWEQGRIQAAWFPRDVGRAGRGGTHCGLPQALVYGKREARSQASCGAPCYSLAALGIRV